MRADTLTKPTVTKYRLKWRDPYQIKRYFGPFAFNVETGESIYAYNEFDARIRTTIKNKLYTELFEFLAEECDRYPTVHVAKEEPIGPTEEEYLAAKIQEIELKKQAESPWIIVMANEVFEEEKAVSKKKRRSKKNKEI